MEKDKIEELTEDLSKARKKCFLLEGQTLHMIKDLESKLDKLEKDWIKGDVYCEKDYHFLKTRYNGAMDYLTMLLTCYDNPLSNFEAKTIGKYPGKNK